MSVPSLTDPCFRPDPADLAFLDDYTRWKYIEKRKIDKATQKLRKTTSERIAVTASERLLSSLGPGWTVIDANTIKRNMDGHDLLVSRTGAPARRLRIQVKGSSYIENLQWWPRANTDAADWGYDVLLLVDIGVTMAAPGRFAKLEPFRHPHVVFYVFSRSQAVSELAHAIRDPEDEKVFIYRYWLPRRANSLEGNHQIQDIGLYRGRFETIEKALEAL